MRSIVLLALLAACASPTPAETLLVGNKGEDTLSLIDLATGVERARVPTGRMPHEIAISPDGAQAAVVAYGGTTIDIVDIASATKLRTIDLAPNEGPHGLVWLDDGRLIATTERSQSLSIVGRSGAVPAVSTGQEGSHMVAVTSDGSRVYVANIGSGTVSVIDANARAKLRDLAVGGQPEGIALTPDGRQLWVGDLSAPRVQVFDTTRFEKLGEVAVDPVAIRVAISPDGRTAVTSNVAAGTLTEIDVATRAVRRTIPVSGDKAAAQVTILFSPDGSKLYAAETGRNQVAEIDMASGKVLRRIAAGEDGDGLAIAPAEAKTD